MKQILLISISICLLQVTYAQLNTDSVVQQVDRNNKAIQSNIKYWEAKQLEYKTGLTPTNPLVEYDYLYGTPVGAGNQRDFAVTQRFDFPTVYKRKKELSVGQSAQAGLQQQVFRQNILLEAKLLSLHVIYLNRKAAELKRRKTNIEKLVNDYKLKAEKGEVIILDYNKAKLQLLGINNEVALNENERTITLTKLAEMNAGNSVVITDTIYPIVPFIPSFELLDSSIEANDPIIKVVELEKRILEKQISVQRAMNLPKLETGYRAQSILGQSYQGIQMGVTIPLWENKNKLSAAKSNLAYAGSAAETIRLEHRMENRQYYEQLAVREKIMNEHRELLLSLNNTTLLNKALALGQITVIQYFYEESFYFTVYDQYLKAEGEYHAALARLFKYQL